LVKYASEKSLNNTKFFELLLFGILLFVRTALPRAENWNMRSTLNLLMQDVIYISDSIDFLQILFDTSRTTSDNSLYKNLVLWNLAFTSCFFCFNINYKPRQVHTRDIFNGNLNRLQQIELRLAYDPFIRFIIPALFFEIPMIIARIFIFCSYKSVNWNNFTYLFKNITGLILTVLAYLEIREIPNESVFYSSTSQAINV
jgi:hypothetical protein